MSYSSDEIGRVHDFRRRWKAIGLEGQKAITRMVQWLGLYDAHCGAQGHIPSEGKVPARIALELAPNGEIDALVNHGFLRHVGKGVFYVCEWSQASEQHAQRSAL